MKKLNLALDISDDDNLAADPVAPVKQIVNTVVKKEKDCEIYLNEEPEVDFDALND